MNELQRKHNKLKSYIEAVKLKTCFVHWTEKANENLVHMGGVGALNEYAYIAEFKITSFSDLCMITFRGPELSTALQRRKAEQLVNQLNIQYDFATFGITNKNEIFVVTSYLTDITCYNEGTIIALFTYALEALKKEVTHIKNFIGL